MDILPGGNMDAMNRARRALEDCGVDFANFVLIGELVGGGSSKVCYISGGRDGGSEAAAHFMLDKAAPIARDTIFPPEDGISDGEFYEDEEGHIEDDDEEAGGGSA